MIIGETRGEQAIVCRLGIAIELDANGRLVALAVARGQFIVAVHRCVLRGVQEAGQPRGHRPIRDAWHHRVFHARLVRQLGSDHLVFGRVMRPVEEALHGGCVAFFWRVADEMHAMQQRTEQGRVRWLGIGLAIHHRLQQRQQTQHLLPVPALLRLHRARHQTIKQRLHVLHRHGFVRPHKRQRVATIRFHLLLEHAELQFAAAAHLAAGLIGHHHDALELAIGELAAGELRLLVLGLLDLARRASERFRRQEGFHWLLLELLAGVLGARQAEHIRARGVEVMRHHARRRDERLARTNASTHEHLQHPPRILQP